MRRRRTFAFLSLLLVAGCSDDEAAPTRPGGGEGPDLTGVVYEGATTDEALERLLDATPKDDPKRYVIVASPDLSAPLSAEAPVTFEYHLATEAFQAPAPRSKAAPAAPAWQRSLREVLQLLGPPRVAHAHGAPFNGTGYFLELHGADGGAILRVFTSKQSYTPDADAWQRVVNAPPPLTLEITSAFFEDNDVPADGGPFVGGSFELAIE